MKRTNLTLALCLFGSATATAELYLNELYFDPPGSTGDILYEYIELRGTPNMSLQNHYLLFLENEGQDGGNGTITGSTGTLDAWFDLSGMSVGSNGFLVLRQADFLGGTANPYTVDPGAADFKQSVPFSGWGTQANPSTIGWNSDNFRIENSGFTALLIHSGDTPASLTVGQDFDEGNDGLDPLPAGWTVLDAIGVASEENEVEFGRLYAPINFGVVSDPALANIEPGAEFVAVDFEIEYIARLGNSTGQTAGDWWVGNLTDNPRREGFVGLPSAAPDFRLSAKDGPAGDHTGDVEASTDQFEYATIITNHLGQANPGTPVTTNPGLAGDYNDSGSVEQGDLDLVLNNWGGPRGAGFIANAEGFDTGNVDQEELDRVLNNWGSSNSPAVNGASVPEPGLAALGAIALLAGLRRRR